MDLLFFSSYLYYNNNQNRCMAHCVARAARRIPVHIAFFQDLENLLLLFSPSVHSFLVLSFFFFFFFNIRTCRSKSRCERAGQCAKESGGRVWCLVFLQLCGATQYQCVFPPPFLDILFDGNSSFFCIKAFFSCGYLKKNPREGWRSVRGGRWGMASAKRSHLYESMPKTK